MTGKRQLVQSIEPCEGQFLDEAVLDISQGSQWQKPVGSDRLVYAETYYDTSGYELDDLTLGPLSVSVQDPGSFMLSDPGQCFEVYDLITVERLTSSDLLLIEANNTGFKSKGIGFADGPLDRAQIITGRFRLFTDNNTQTGFPELMLPSRKATFGSGHASTARKLWVYKIVVFRQFGNAGTIFRIPPTHYILNAEIFKEADLEYMMRLKRSYELSANE